MKGTTKIYMTSCVKILSIIFISLHHIYLHIHGTALHSGQKPNTYKLMYKKVYNAKDSKRCFWNKLKKYVLVNDIVPGSFKICWLILLWALC